MKVGMVAGIGLLAAACATTQPPQPQMIVFKGLAPDGPAAKIDDSRPRGETKTRSGNIQGMRYHYLGDDAAYPPVMTLLATTIAKSLPESLRGAPIEVRHAQLGFWQEPPPAHGSLGVPGFAGPLPALVFAQIAVLGAAHLAQHGDEPPTPIHASADFEVVVGARPIKVRIDVLLDEKVTEVEALEAVLSTALASLSTELRRAP